MKLKIEIDNPTNILNPIAWIKKEKVMTYESAKRIFKERWKVLRSNTGKGIKI